MEDYVRRHTAGSILRSVFRIYGRHATILVGSAIVPLIPTVVIELIRWQDEPSVWPTALGAFLSVVNVVPVTVLISDICVGNPPSLGRAYRLAFGRVTGTVFLTIVLVTLILIGGFLLLVVPGIIFGMWYGFAGVVVVLERTSARGALTRSRELGKGYYLRNAGIWILTAVVSFTPVYVVAGILGAVMGFLGFPLSLANLIGTVLGALGSPPTSIAIVLLYYDLRVRKEAYDSTKLAEDLRR